MKEFKLNNKTYNIPEKWDEVTVGMLVKAHELSELLPDAPIIAIMSAYTGIPVSELKAKFTNEVTEILEIMDFIKDDYKPHARTTFTLDDNTYACETELVNQRFEDFVSIQTALYNYREEPVRALPRLIAILCKKEGETLDDFNLNERTDIMYRLPMTKAKDVEAFFLHTLNAYRTVSLLSSTQDIQKELVLNKIKELNSTMNKLRGQGGISFGTKIRIGVYQIQLWWVKKVLEKYFNSQVTNNSKKNWLQTFRKLLTRKVKGAKVKYDGKI